MKELKLQDLKDKSAADLSEYAKENPLQRSSSVRKKELLYAYHHRQVVLFSALFVQPDITGSKETLILVR